VNNSRADGFARHDGTRRKALRVMKKYGLDNVSRIYLGSRLRNLRRALPLHRLAGPAEVEKQATAELTIPKQWFPASAARDPRQFTS
jgi:hypothetical protein